jgi:hypothetical protein
MFWNPFESTERENLQWTMLRALEWEAFPAFISQPVVPVLFIFIPWYYAVGGVIVLSWIWAALRHVFVSILLSELGFFFVKLKWLTIPFGTAYLFYTGHYVLAVVSLLWTVLASLVGFTVPGGKTGVIQDMFLRALGFQLDDSRPTLSD